MHHASRNLGAYHILLIFTNTHHEPHINAYNTLHIAPKPAMMQWGRNGDVKPSPMSFYGDVDMG